MNDRDLQHLKASLEELHRFKALLFELSARFSSLSLDGENSVLNRLGGQILKETFPRSTVNLIS